LVTSCIETSLPKHISERQIDERIEGMRRWERRSKQLLYDLDERRWYWQLNEEELDCILCKIHFEVAMDLS